MSRFKVLGHSYDLEIYEEVLTDPEKGTIEFDEVGVYSANSILTLVWIVLKHRFEHLLAGEGWRD
jgi:hypothetical protein|tara:strand:- start:502 stop:696 length:195 start_codon:yes stop_codon:yes gene_type:complete